MLNPRVSSKALNGPPPAAPALVKPAAKTGSDRPPESISLRPGAVWPTMVVPSPTHKQVTAPSPSVPTTSSSKVHKTPEVSSSNPSHQPPQTTSLPSTSPKSVGSPSYTNRVSGMWPKLQEPTTTSTKAMGSTPSSINGGKSPFPASPKIEQNRDSLTDVMQKLLIAIQGMGNKTQIQTFHPPTSVDPMIMGNRSLPDSVMGMMSSSNSQDLTYLMNHRQI